MKSAPLKLAINNRGEVALRVIRTCQEMGIKTVLLHSTPDKNTLAFTEADETVELPGQTPQETYLNIPTVMEALKKAGAKLVHPGFGFLSENANFARAVEEAQLFFVGPSSSVIELAGNKVRAKKQAAQAGVPTTPAYSGNPAEAEEFLKAIRKLGFPCIVKAASGGGGKGMKRVENEKELFEKVASAQREAQGAFGSTEIFVEKYLIEPRHIEVQIFGDANGDVLHFFERDCSIQRRHQKIFEESPSSSLDASLREKITSAAIKIAKSLGYKNAGTVEFLVAESGEFYFMELNTRLQVEHTVTEETCGIDFVRLQIATALGESLSLQQPDIKPRGHALEVRLYAENPEKEFLPSTGKIKKLILPRGPHRRFDFGYGEGQEVTPFYDPMIGKIITWAPTRAENIMRMKAVLDETIVFGLHTNIEFLKAVVQSSRFEKGILNTSFLEIVFPKGFTPTPLSQEQVAFGQECVLISSQGALTTQGGWTSPWYQQTGRS